MSKGNINQSYRNKPQYRADLPALDHEYAELIVEHAPELERVQRMLPLVPDSLVELMYAQPDEFLFGMVTMGQALHDLIGSDVLLEVAQILEKHSDNTEAVSLGNAAVKMVAILEAINFIACEEVLNRKEGVKRVGTDETESTS
jgi:hypothetical protein